MSTADVPAGACTARSNSSWPSGSVAEFHTYAVDWRPGSLEFSVDGSVVKRVGQAPDYPVQLEIAVFDFPDRAHLVPGEVPVPELIVTDVIGP